MNDKPIDSMALAYVQRQTARRLIEEVIRNLSQEGAALTALGEDKTAADKLVQVGKLRDALVLLVGD